MKSTLFLSVLILSVLCYYIVEGYGGGFRKQYEGEDKFGKGDGYEPVLFPADKIPGRGQIVDPGFARIPGRYPGGFGKGLDKGFGGVEIIDKEFDKGLDKGFDGGKFGGDLDGGYVKPKRRYGGYGR